MWKFQSFRCLIRKMCGVLKRKIASTPQAENDFASGRYYHRPPYGPNAYLAKRDEWKILSYRMML